MRTSEQRICGCEKQHRIKAISSVEKGHVKSPRHGYFPCRGLFGLVRTDTPDEVVAALESALEKISLDPEFILSMTEMTEICKFVGSEELTKQVNDGCATIQAMLEELPNLLG